MDELLTYSLTDFLLFTPATYYRQFELHNSAVWPSQPLTFGAGVAILLLLRRPSTASGRTIAALLATCWLWVGFAFHLQRYATINWAALYLAAAFAAQALLLAWTGVARGRLVVAVGRDPASRAGLALLVFALLLQPLLGPLLGRSWAGIELFGTAPDPTAVATVGLLLTSAGRPPWLLLVIPLLWCAFGGATLWAMAAPDAWILPLAALIGLGLAAWRVLRAPCARQDEALHAHR